MQLWDRFLAIFRSKRATEVRHYELNDELQTALVERAYLDQKPADVLHAEILAAGLADLQASDKLKASWARLTPREAEVIALVCLGYTNQEIAARFGISPYTITTHIRRAMLKFGFHKKSELSTALSGWDFSEWDKPSSRPPLA